MAGGTTKTDTIGRWPAEAYRATFAPQDPQDEVTLPPGWHKLFFVSTPGLDQLRPDGTPAADGVTPDIPLPRRLYAGEELAFHRPIRYGETLQLSTRLGHVAEKTGSGGALVFVTLDSSILSGPELVVSIRQHDVFLAEGGAAKPLAAGPARGDLDWLDETVLTPAHLFRFSALTFNTHRIHYDRDWVRKVEGQPDLLVHGPLLEMMLLDFAVRNAGGRTVAGFSVRIQAPTYVDTVVRFAGRARDDGADLWVLDTDGGIVVTGSVTWGEG